MPTISIASSPLVAILQAAFRVWHTDEFQEAEMDPALLTALAASAFTVLQPHLSELAQSAAEALGKKVPDAIGALWGKLRARFADKPAADEALKDLLANPDDSDLQAAFRVQLKKLLQDDAGFADEVKGLVESTGKQTSYTAEVHGSGAVAQGPGAVAAGEGGIAIGGSVGGNVGAPSAPAESEEDKES